ncbi:MAG: hypothetical protein WA830_05000 [Candidatus Sulfotelmatobacter sp.]
MHTRLKTLGGPVPLLVVKRLRGSATILLTVCLLGSNALSQSEVERLGMSANELTRRVVANELESQVQDRGRWMYRLEKEESGRKQVQNIIETNQGSLSRLVSTDGRLLNPRQEQTENQRIQRLVSHPDEQRKLQQASAKKAEQGARLFRILPNVFLFSYVRRQGDLVTLAFRPNPNFQPPSLEARVFHGMQGEMTVDTKQERLAAINGRLVEDVNFGGGLLGHLDKGGKFEVRQAEVSPWHWEMVSLTVDMKGKALLFKTVGVYETESHSDFHQMPRDLTLAEAAGILNKQTVVADNR